MGRRNEPGPVTLSAAERKSAVTILRDLLRTPTAPFLEHAVLQKVEQRLEFMRCQRDQHGNLLALPRGRRAGGHRRVFFVAHADHPGFVARRMLSDDLLLADWHGGVEPGYFPGSAVRFFLQDRPPVTGRIAKIVQWRQSRGRQKRVAQVAIRLARSATVEPGTPGTWAVMQFALRNDKVVAAACDDVAGLAAVVAAFVILSDRQTPLRAGVLVTRAEEAGLIGATGAVLTGTLPAGASVISVECSKETAAARLGDGPVIRLGDRLSTFDAELCDWLADVAGRLAEARKDFRYQRNVMPGGTCEASVFRAAGHRAAGLCVPLRNYHNRNEARKRIAAEQISLHDWFGLVALVASAATLGLPKAAAPLPLAGMFRQAYRHYRRALKDPLLIG